MPEVKPRNCGRCGEPKQIRFRHCAKCIQEMTRNGITHLPCTEQDCGQTVEARFALCYEHWQQAGQGLITECPECGVFKPAAFRLCRQCNAREKRDAALGSRRSVPRPQRQEQQHQGSGHHHQQPPPGRQHQGGQHQGRQQHGRQHPPGQQRRPSPDQVSFLGREQHHQGPANGRQHPNGNGQPPDRGRSERRQNGEGDAKARDKRYWFNAQNNGVCNYCGNRYQYNQLQMEHMIPLDMGGPSHWRNMQLACRSCNKKKGTMTDLEFRKLNYDLIPLEERTPPSRPIDPRSLRAGTKWSRYQGEDRHEPP